jgi:hypothetical protein
VIRTGSRFTTEVISLVGSKLFSKIGGPIVTATILPLEVAAQLTNSFSDEKSILSKKCGDINNNNQIFENGRTSQAKFQNLQFKSIKRNKSIDCVSEELFSLTFHANIRSNGMNVPVVTSSLPIGIVSHDSQRIKANATILWNSAGNQFFETEKELPWMQVN